MKDNTLSVTLKMLRKQHGLTQEELASVRISVCRVGKKARTQHYPRPYA